MIVKKIKDVKIRDDGNQAQITFEGSTGQINLTMDFETMQDFVSKTIQLLTAARFNRAQHSDTPKEFAAARDVLLVTEAELALNPDRSLDLVVQTRDKRTFQISLLPEHAEFLRQILSGNGNEHRLM